MVVVLFTISVTGFCRNTHFFELSAASPTQTGSYLTAVEKGCPICPIDEHSVPDHCDSSCYCACHAPLAPQPVEISCSQLVSSLVFAEPFKAIPEVYLSMFIPPQIHA